MTRSDTQADPPPEMEERERWETLRDLEDWIRMPMVVLSLVWLALVVADLLWPGNDTFTTLGAVIQIIFILEFLLRLFLAPRKLAFLRANLLTVIALLVPAFRMLAVFRALRFLRLARGVRLVRVVATANRGMNALRTGLGKWGFGYVLGVTLLVEVLGAAGMMAFESEATAPGNFRNFGDALWWTAMILTTMGSSYWPVTTEGRVLCLLLSIYAFTIFGYITAGFASFLIGRDNMRRSADPVVSELKALRQEIAALRLRGTNPPGEHP